MSIAKGEISGIEEKGLPSWADDTLAKAENKKWGDDDALQGIKKRNEAWVLKVWGLIVPFLMILFTLLFVVSIFAWAWHYLTPWGWLKPDQLSKIQSVIFSGALGAIVTNYFKKRLLD
jgi:hypothetical protein